MSLPRLKNYIGGEWVEAEASEVGTVMNPALDEPIAEVPLCGRREVDQAVHAAKEAFWEWRSTPPITRARYFMRLKDSLERDFEKIARQVTMENGKIIDEARGEVRRCIENVETAIGIPTLMMGYNAEDIAEGIDEEVVRQPLGVFCCIAPFNFPAMVPFWFLPYAIASGNTYVVKPSPQTPISQSLLFQSMAEVGFPEGVFNLVNGANEAADALLEHPDVKGVSFVGSTPVGRHIYQKACEHGKRAQCQAGAKNCLVVMPDAQLDRSVAAIMTSAYGCAGERCLAGSLVLAVGDVYEGLKAKLVDAAASLKVGYGLDESVHMGPVVSRTAQQRIVGYIDHGIAEGAKLLLDGRGLKVEGYPKGYFVGPTIFDDVDPSMVIAKDEIFGPVLGIIRVPDFEAALKVIDDIPYGNAASLFTSSGKWAREFKYRVACGNIGINLGIAAPMSFFPFGGMKQSFFGDQHGQGQDAVRFFTDSKVVITRWL